MTTYLKCEHCGIIEREEWALADKHVCGTYTDPQTPIFDGMKIKVGKKKLFKIKIEKPT